MTRRTAIPVLLSSPLLLAQNPAQSPVPQAPEDYVCPMDADVRAAKPGTCPRCGMKLVLGIPDPVEYPMDLKIQPSSFRAGDPVQLAFRIGDPKSGSQVQKFEIVHEKLFHMFIVSQDLGYFVHEHPVFGPDAVFRYKTSFPHSGMFRVLGDFYPAGGTPQLITKTVIVPGRGSEDVSLVPAQLTSSLSPNQCENTNVELTLEPAQPIAGLKTLMFFKLNPADGFEKYLGAWGHMLTASDDTIDLIHNHPFIADGGPQVQFNLIFPRARMYRVWVQFQRNGVVNTAAFNVPVSELK